MNFYYDIKLNFLENNYYFYEWSNQDKVINIKKIPLFRIDFDVLQDMYKYNIKVNKEFLTLIDHKTKTNNKNIKYAALFGDRANAIALLFNEKGQTIKRSSLIFEDDLNINEILFSVHNTKLEYTKEGLLPLIKEARINEVVKEEILKEFASLFKTNNYPKISYLYNEWFNKEETNFDIIKETINNRLKEKITEKEYLIYQIIKSSYKKV